MKMLENTESNAIVRIIKLTEKVPALIAKISKDFRSRKSLRRISNKITDVIINVDKIRIIEFKIEPVVLLPAG